MPKTKMLVARLPCGCVAAADFVPEDPTSKDGVMEWLMKDGYIVRMEERELIWAQKCFRHEVAYLLKHPASVYWHSRHAIARLLGTRAISGTRRVSHDTTN